MCERVFQKFFIMMSRTVFLHCITAMIKFRGQQQVFRALQRSSPISTVSPTTCFDLSHQICQLKRIRSIVTIIHQRWMFYLTSSFSQRGRRRQQQIVRAFGTVLMNGLHQFSKGININCGNCLVKPQPHCLFWKLKGANHFSRSCC